MVMASGEDEKEGAEEVLAPRDPSHRLDRYRVPCKKENESEREKVLLGDLDQEVKQEARAQSVEDDVKGQVQRRCFAHSQEKLMAEIGERMPKISRWD